MERSQTKPRPHTDGQKSCPWCSKGTLWGPAVWRLVLGHLSMGRTTPDSALSHFPCHGPLASSLPCRAICSWEQYEAGGSSGVHAMALALSYPTAHEWARICQVLSGANKGTKAWRGDENSGD